MKTVLLARKQNSRSIDQSLFLSSLLTVSHGDVGEAPFLFKTPPQVIVTTIDGAGSALALHEIVAVFGLNFITADVTPNCISNDHCVCLLYVSE